MTVETYLNALPKNSRNILDKFRDIARRLAPDATEEICYGIPTFKLKNKNIVHFGAYKNHIGFYPTSELIELFKSELKEYRHSKGAVQFPVSKMPPFDLIEKIIKCRIDKLMREG
jgi:uncharacterized protein YdhG (YjbR/CyaY superfamily)